MIVADFGVILIIGFTTFMLGRKLDTIIELLNDTNELLYEDKEDDDDALAGAR